MRQLKALKDVRQDVVLDERVADMAIDTKAWRKNESKRLTLFLLWAAQRLIAVKECYLLLQTNRHVRHLLFCIFQWEASSMSPEDRAKIAQRYMFSVGDANDNCGEDRGQRDDKWSPFLEWCQGKRVQAAVSSMSGDLFDDSEFVSELQLLFGEKTDFDLCCSMARRSLLGGICGVRWKLQRNGVEGYPHLTLRGAHMQHTDEARNSLAGRVVNAHKCCIDEGFTESYLDGLGADSRHETGSSTPQQVLVQFTSPRSTCFFSRPRSRRS